MKKSIIIIFILMLTFLVGCNNKNPKENPLEEEKTEEEKIFEAIENAQINGLTFTAELKNTEKNIILHNAGEINKKDTSYEFSYSFQYLNSINSDSEELVSTIEDTIEASENEIIKSLKSYSYSTSTMSLSGLSFKKNVLKNISIKHIGNLYILSSQIDSEYLHILDDNLDINNVYNCSIYASDDFARIEKVIITYKTESFDAITITLNYR